MVRQAEDYTTCSTFNIAGSKRQFRDKTVKTWSIKHLLNQFCETSVLYQQNTCDLTEQKHSSNSLETSSRGVLKLCVNLLLLSHF